MHDGKCPKCKGKEFVPTFRIRVCINDGEKDHTITLFEEDSCTLFGALQISTQEKLIEECVAKLPIHFKAKLHNNTLYEIST